MEIISEISGEKGIIVDHVRLSRVYPTEIEILKDYVERLYQHDEDFDAVVNIEEGVKSLMRNEHLATAYFIKREQTRIGYVILTKYHSIEKGGLTIYIDELYVEEAERRGGVGRAIMAEIIEVARQEGAKALWAQAEPVNDAAEAFFLSQGFNRNIYKNFERPL